MFSYGIASDLLDEYLRMSKTTGLEAMYKFCRATISVFGDLYLREPTFANTSRLLSTNEERGFMGMIRSIDCMH
jgi:hypothetical protein